MSGRDPIDWRQVRLIVSTGCRMDLRGPRWGTESARRMKHPFLIGLASLAFMSIFLSTASLHRHGAFAYSTLNLGYLMIVICSAVLGELHTVLLNPVDLELIASRPVGTRTFFWAKTIHLGVYAGLMTAALSLWPALFGGLLRWGPGFGAAYLAAALGASGAVALGCLAVYGTLVRNVSSERLKDALVWAQIVLAVASVMAYQVVGQNVQGLEWIGDRGVPAWAFALPPAWFSAWTCLTTWPAGGLPISGGLGLAGTGLAALFFLALVPLRTFSFGYAEFLLTQAVTGDAPVAAAGDGRWARAWARLWRHPVERAAFLFAWSFMGRDRGFRMRFYPSCAIFLVMTLGALLLKDRVDPVGLGLRAGSAGGYAMASLYVPCLFLPMLLGSTCHTDQWKASWIFHLLGPDERAGLVRGILGAMAVRFLLPVLAVLWAILSWWWRSPVHAALHVSVGLPILYIGVALGRLFVREFPFGSEIEPGGQTSRMFMNLMLFYFLILPFVFGLGAAQLMAYNSPVGIVGFAAGAFGLGGALDLAGRWRLRRVLGKLEFAG